MKLDLKNYLEVLLPEQDEFLAGFASVVKDRDILYLYYTYGYPKHLIGVATSGDGGRTWQRHRSSNPIIRQGDRGSWKDREVWCPIVWLEDGVFKMLFTGRNTDLDLAVGLAFSHDGINFNEHSDNPVLTGTKGTWDESGIEAWGIIKRDEAYGAYMLFYSTLRKEPRQLGRAFSSDLLNWTKNSEPMFSNPQISYFCPSPFQTSRECGLFVSERNILTGRFRIELYSGNSFENLHDSGSLILPYELKSLDTPFVCADVYRNVDQVFNLLYSGSKDEKSPAHWATYSVDVQIVEEKALHILRGIQGEDLEQVKANARAHNLPLTVMNRKNAIHYSDMPHLLKGFTHYVDLTYLPEMSKTGFQALSLGLTVIRWDGKEVKELPPENDPENVARLILSRIQGQGTRILHVLDTAGCGTAIAHSMDKYCGTTSKVVNRKALDPFGFTENSWDVSPFMFAVKLIVEARKHDIIIVHAWDKCLPSLRKLYPNKFLIMYYHGSDIRLKGGWTSRRKYWWNADAIFIATGDLAKLPGCPQDVVRIPLVIF